MRGGGGIHVIVDMDKYTLYQLALDRDELQLFNLLKTFGIEVLKNDFLATSYV